MYLLTRSLRWLLGVILARVIGGLLGSFTGRVGAIVGVHGRSGQNVRAWVNPDNTPTPNRLLKRGRWAACATMARAATPDILRPFVSPYLRSMSGFNWFIHENIQKFVGDFELDTVHLTFGNLFCPSINSAVLSGDQCLIVFAGGLGNNGLNSDFVYGCCYDRMLGRLTMADSAVNRDNPVLTVNIPAGHSEYNYIFAYIWPVRWSVDAKLLMVGCNQGTYVGEG